MRKRHHTADLVGAGVYLGLLGDTDESRGIARIVLYGPFDGLESVYLGTVDGADGGYIASVALADQLGGDCGILAEGDLDVWHGLEKLLALSDGLMVRHYLLDVLELHVWLTKEVMIDPELDGAHDIKLMVDHEIINLVDRAVGADKDSAWYPNMLGADNVHPDVNGAAALYSQVLVDFPEIMNRR